MVTRDGTTYPTIGAATSHFGVAEKTVYDWIKRGIIPEPDRLEHGARSVYVFDDQYLARADRALKAHRDRKRRRASRATTAGTQAATRGDGTGATGSRSLQQRLRSLAFDGSLRQEFDAAVDDPDLQID